jgi:hypothetical protein
METLGLEAYAHPRTITAVMRLFESYRWWENAFFAPFASKRRLLTAARKLRLLPLVARLFETDITRNTREEVNIYTIKLASTPSCAQVIVRATAATSNTSGRRIRAARP